MIDWGKISGPSTAPGPTAPTTTTPVAPAAPGSLAIPGSLASLTAPAPANPQVNFGDGQMTDAEKNMTKEQVDALGPLGQAQRGWDQLGDFLFGEKSALHDTVFEDVAGAVGGLGKGIGDVSQAPFKAGADLLHAVPLGWLPGGADETFGQIGKWASENDPELYQRWKLVDAAAAGEWGAGDMHADFNTEALKYIDDKHYDTALGPNPTFGIGRAGVGSLGDAMTDAVGGFLGFFSNEAQQKLGNAGAFDFGQLPGSVTLDELKAAANGNGVVKWGDAGVDPSTYHHELGITDEQREVVRRVESGEWTQQKGEDYIAMLRKGGRTRVDEIGARADLGIKVSEVEQNALDAFRSGAWSKDHANTWLITHGQGISSEPLKQIALSVATDPLTFATIGAGSLAKAGATGARIAEAAGTAGRAGSAGEALTNLRQANSFAEVVYATQRLQVAGHELGPAFRIARGLVDPLAVYKPSAVARAVTDLKSGAAITAFERAYGYNTTKDLRAIAREFELGHEIDSAIASYSLDQADLMVARHSQRNLLAEGLGEDMVHTLPDDVISPMVENASRDAVTKLTDHMYQVAKNTFTAEEEATLAGRLATTFGNDVPYWAKRMSTMSDDLKSALHAVTYKRAEVAFEQARGAVDRAAYTGDLPIDNMVLMSNDTLDDVVAQTVIDNIRDVLKSEELEGRIAAATAEWNAQAARFPKMANIGYATGGKTQLEALVKELEKELKSGGITRRALPEELADPALSPIRNMLDRHSVPGGAEAVGPKPRTGPTFAPRSAPARIPNGMYKSTVANGGGTFDVATGKAVPATSGYGVATGTSGKVVENTKAAVEAAYKEVSLSGTPQIGTWVNPEDGLVYVDPTEVVDSLDKALALGKERGEKAIYDFAAGKDIPISRVENAPMWRVGFRPDEEVAWGLKRANSTGRYVVDRAPTISHVVDAVPGRQHFSDTTRNVLGQVIGKSKAERLNKPIDSIEAMVNTMRDMITGRRLVMNIEKRFEKTTFAAGIPKPISKEIMSKAREVAGLDYTTVRGIKPDNLWNAISDIIPRDLVLTDGTTLNVHTVMDHLLQAAEGDLRVMGVTSVLSQRMRNALRRAGLDPANWAGQMTVTMYNKLRYSQPMFVIQRITDAPYYSILYGQTPVGKGALTGAKAELEKITENLGASGLARDFSMDMPEYATRTNFTAGIKSAMQEAGLKENRLDRILRAPDVIIANNMTNMLHARLGNIVKGVLDNLTTAAEKANPELQADMLAAGEQFQNTFADWRQVYSEQAGRVLTDEEVGLQYIKDQLNAWRRHVVNSDGTLDLKGLIREGERSLPSSIGELGPIHPDGVAQELGYADADALRRDVTGHIEKINGEFVLVKGEHDIPWLEEQLRTQLTAHPDYVTRAKAYFGDTWEGFWGNLERPIAEGGLDISAHYAKEAQEVIARIAGERGMDPWEYLSGAMATNLGPADLNTSVGKLVAFLKGGPGESSISEWGSFIRSHLDPSAQQTLVDAWKGARTGATGSIETKMAAGDVAGSQADNLAEAAAKGGTAESGGAIKAGSTGQAPTGIEAKLAAMEAKSGSDVPAGFTRNPHVAASGTTTPELPRDGLFHVTTATDKVKAEGFKAGEAIEGFGSKGDKTGRISILTNRARSQTYMDRMILSVKAARGEATLEQVGDYFRPLYEKAFGEEAATRMADVAGTLAAKASTPEELHQLVRLLDGGLIGGKLDAAERAVKLMAPFESAKAIDPAQISMLELATNTKAQVKQGLDTGELTLLPEDLHVMQTDTGDIDKFFESGLEDMLKQRVASGVPHSNPDVESVIQEVARLTQNTLKGTTAEGETRKQLRSLVEAIPTSNAAPFNRTQALVVSLLKDKISDAQQDIFRLAEMQTQRSVLERSLNHPLFGIYPASYMWGKVLPESVKFFARNPFAATYAIADVQRSIAIMREYDRDMEDKINTVDRSSAAFLLDYLTPGLPWNAHDAGMSPMVRDLLKGAPDQIWTDELRTVSPERWISVLAETGKEALDFVHSLQQEGTDNPLPDLTPLTNEVPPPVQPGGSSQITGPTKAAGLAPILQDDLSRLQSILLGGASPEE